MAKNHLQILFFIGILIKLSSAQIRMRKGYGEFCNVTIKCNSQSWLRCGVDNICECSKPEHMMFNQKVGQCVARAGERCKYRLDKEPLSIYNQENSGQQVGRPNGPIIFEEVLCVENADCTNEGLCVCRRDYYEDAFNGTCLPIKGVNEECSSSSECSQYESLKCIEGRCSCDFENSILYKEECVGLPGRPCLNYRCSENAKCSIPNPYVNHKFHTFHGSTRLSTLRPSQPLTSQGKCVCANGFTLSSNGRECFSNYRHFCNADSRCDPEKYICIDGTCHCKSPLHQIFSEKYGSCLSLVGGSCDFNKHENVDFENMTMMENSTISFVSMIMNTSVLPLANKMDNFRQCVDGAECVKKPSIKAGFYGTCECRKGYVENSDGMCNIGYGEKCPVIQSISETQENLFCDKLAPLNCIEGKCSCPDSLNSIMFDHDKRKCVGLIGSRCRKNSKFECVSNALCIHKHEKLMGRCECEMNFKSNNNRTCEPLDGKMDMMRMRTTTLDTSVKSKGVKMLDENMDDVNNLEFVEEGSGDN